MGHFPLKNFDCIVLLFLASQPSCGYTILNQAFPNPYFSQRPNQSSLYNTLHKLALLGLINPHIQTNPKAPSRAIYHISPKGKKLLSATVYSFIEGEYRELASIYSKYRAEQSIVQKIEYLFNLWSQNGSQFRARFE